MKALIIPAGELEPTDVELAKARSIIEGRSYSTATINVGGRTDFAVEELARALAAGDTSRVAALVRQMRADVQVLRDLAEALIEAATQ